MQLEGKENITSKGEGKVQLRPDSDCIKSFLCILGVQEGMSTSCSKPTTLTNLRGQSSHIR